MHKTKNHYIKYTRNELENYTKLPESCVKKINCVEPIRFSPTIIADFQSAILRILSKKIGKYDVRLKGIVLDFRNTKVLGSQTGIRQDSAFSVINVETNFYVFSPRQGAVVTGDLKYINRLNMETVLTVVIYRVFNVKVTVKGKVKQELERNQEIQIRVKDFHFDNVIPFIEGEFVKLLDVSVVYYLFHCLIGEIVDTGIIIKSRKIFDDTIDSGISESSVTSEVHKDSAGPSGIKSIKVKQERESSVESTQEKTKKARKRKQSSDSDSDAAPMKKVKQEPMTTVKEDDEPIAVQRIKREKLTSESDDSSAKKSSNLPATSKGTKKAKKSKKKKKKRYDSDDEDDFETSLANLLNSTVKSRK